MMTRQNTEVGLLNWNPNEIALNQPLSHSHTTYDGSPAVCLRFVRRLDDENNQFGQQTTRSSFASSAADRFPQLFKYSDIENVIANGNNLCTEGILPLRILQLGDIFIYIKI